MKNFRELDLQQIWLETMGWNEQTTANRQFDDRIESEFWLKLAPRYTDEYNINKDTHLVATKLAALLGANKSILEIGCGSGNFTVLMAAYSWQILGLDFSPAMLDMLHQRLQYTNIANISTQATKWEDFSSKEQFDYIVSVNSLYRISDMQQALLKMNAYSQQGFIIVRTIQCPLLSPLYKACELPFVECLDYQLLPLLLWRNNIKAQVEFVNYSRSKTYPTLESVQAEMLLDLGQPAFKQHRQILLDKFTAQARHNEQGYTIAMPRTTVFISYHKSQELA